MKHICTKYSCEANNSNLLGIFLRLVPKIFLPIPLILDLSQVSITSGDGTVTGDITLFNTGNVAASLVCNLVVLMTFGSAYPPLAVIVTIAIWVDTFQWQSLVGLYLMGVEAQVGRQNRMTVNRNSLQYDVFKHNRIGDSTIDRDSISIEQREYLIGLLERNCVGVARVFSGTIWPMLFCVFAFLSFFLFDVIGIYSFRTNVVIENMAMYLLLSPAVFLVPTVVFPVSSDKVFAALYTRHVKDGTLPLLSSLCQSISVQGSTTPTPQLCFDIRDTVEHGAWTVSEIFGPRSSWAAGTKESGHRGPGTNENAQHLEVIRESDEMATAPIVRDGIKKTSSYIEMQVTGPS